MFDVHWASDVRQTQTHTTHTEEPLLPEPSAFEVELAIEKVKSHQSPGIDQIPAELIKAGSGTFGYESHQLIVCGPGRSVGYRDWLGVGRSGDRIPLGARFSASVETGPGAHPASCTMGTRYFPGVESGRGGA
jgi:hypothetical protein